MKGERGSIIFRVMILLLFGLFCAIIYFARHPLLQTAAQFWIVQDPIEPADIIIVLGDDGFAAHRTAEAAVLFRARWAPAVVASGRMLRPYASLADFMARDLGSQGVPESAIIRFSHRAGNTLEEAEGLRVLITEQGWRRILLVTSNYHARRARYIFRKVLPASVSVEVAGASDPEFQPDTWWQSRQGRKTFFLETVGYLVAVWELREQKPASSAGSQPGIGGLFLGLLTGWSPETTEKRALFSLHR